MFSVKHATKPLVLLCVRSKVLKNHWFYFVFAPKSWKNIGFTVFSLKNVKKQLVLLCFRSKMLKKPLVLLSSHSKMMKNHWCYRAFAGKTNSNNGFGPLNCNTRLEKLWGTLTDKLFREPLVLLKKCKKVKKPLVLLWKIVKKSNFAYKTNAFLKKRVVKPVSGHGFGPWVCNTRLDMLWGTLTAKLFRENPV